MFFRTENLPSFKYFRVQPIMLRLLGVCLFVVGAVYAVDEHAWDCVRPTNNCLNGGTCSAIGAASGVCTCTGTYQNFDCSDDSNNDAAANTCNCINGGTCKSDASCVCPETHYGTKCELETIQASCAMDNKILININIPKVADVEVYPPGKKSTCTFVSPIGGNIPSDWLGKSQEISIPTDANCGDPEAKTDAGGNTIGYCTEVIIRHQTSYTSSRDTKAKFCCEDREVTKFVAKITATEVGIRQKDVNQPVAGADKVTAVMTEDDDSTQIPDDATLDLGDAVHLKFTLVSESGYVALRALECRATSYDPQTAGGAGTLNTFLTDSCPDTTSLIIKGTAQNAPDEIIIKTEVVKLDSSDKVYYTCDIKLCTDSSRCAGIVCPAGGTHYGRRKREATAPSNSTTQITRTMVIGVRDPFTKSEVKEAIKEGIAENSQVNMTAAVIGLAVVVLVLLAMCLVLGLCLINKRAPRPEKQFQG